MEIIDRKIQCLSRTKHIIKRIGFNDTGVLSIVFDNEPFETVINFDKSDFKKLKEFLERIDRW